MNELKVLMAKDETMRQLVGLCEEEKERADAAERKLKEMRSILKGLLIKSQYKIAMRDSRVCEACEMLNDLEIILGRFDEESK